MTSRLADLLQATRRHRFVGRGAELALFRSALSASTLPFHVLHVFGPGGVGKTTLLGALADIATDMGIPSVLIDARNVEPSAEGFLSALRLALGLPPPSSPLDALATRSGRHLLFIDTYETLVPLDGWLRDTFLPQLPGEMLVVLAGRFGPAPEWLADAGWRGSLRRLAIGNLDPDDSRTYLTRQSVPDDQHGAVIEFTHGHPLALSLVADVFAQRPGTRFDPSTSPDVVRVLVEQLVQKVPGPAHRAALEASALLRLTTEPLLVAMLAVPDGHELFEWLCGLSFMQVGHLGVFPHDLAREALVAELRWRNPEWYAELHRRARTHYAARLQTTSAAEQQRVLFDYFFLHRENPVVRPFFEWQESGSTLPDRLSLDDIPLLIEMVARHEGEQSAQLARHWLARQPEGTLVFRLADRRPAGFVMLLALQLVTAHDREVDAGVRAAWEYLERHAPLRPGERATHFRFWMADQTYQAVSAMQTLVFGCAAQHYLTTPSLAFSFFPCADADFWAPALGYADLVRLAEADFEVGGRRYGVFGHDWRTLSPLDWLGLLAEREMATTLPPPGQSQSESRAILGQAEFAAAVREALRSLRRGDDLHTNPLLRSRMVVTRAGRNATDAACISALKDLIKEAAEALRASPRDAKAYRALYHTYFRPAATQERAAELLDWPFSTFRRHLKAGSDRMAEQLWAWEIGGPHH